MINHNAFRIFIFLLINSYSFVHANANELDKRRHSSDLEGAFFIVNDSIESSKLITKEFIYDAPKSGKVSFCWISEDFSNEELFRWNRGAKVYKNIVCKSMQKNNLGQFRVSITMPLDSKISFGFWIATSNTGVYQEIWDWKKESITFSSKEQQKFQAIYPRNENHKTSHLVSYGWLIFLTVILALLMLKWLNRFWFKNFEKTPMIKKVILLGIALYLFHILARIEIIKLHPRTLFYDWKNVIYLFKASIGDLFYTALIVSIVIIALFFIKKSMFRNVVFLIFKVIVFMSALFAFTNITTIKLLGHPFNYEWFYYSDFFGSNEALIAIKENVPVFVLFNLIIIPISVFILAKILEYLIAFISTNKYIIYSISVLVFASLVVLINSSFKLSSKYEDSKVENAILSMAHSIFENYDDISLFNLPLDENEVFNPQESNKIKHLNKKEETDVKNVLFIVLESSGAKYFDTYGGQYKITPNLNAYAQNAMIYKNAYAHAPATMKSMVSLFGAIYPKISYKCLTMERPGFQHKTLPLLLKEYDYKTSFFTSADLSYLKGDLFLKNQKFDIIEDFSKINCRSSYKQDMYKEGDAIDDICLADRFKIWLENNSEDYFFSTIWTVQGHYPYFFSQEEEDFGVDNIYFNRYLNTIKNCDKMIGDVIQVLKEKGLFESTLIVVTGDHGEAFNQHENHGHASNIYEENIKIPLYFINPILFNGEQRQDLVSIKDISSTTLSILDLDTPKLWQGRDLISTRHDEVFFFTPFSEYLFGYRKGSKKYIFNETTDKVELYDLSIDPDEKINIIHQTPDSEIATVKKRIASWVQYQDKFVNENILN
ncbi:LTA synthase family protein [Algibacter mikhailovii]|uniref:LTA synthase family protein n=1 Tax=Algibacter mikhailovii TaxID=425498 RepID=UPI002494C1D9|nr:sulfatase [Algibacter mikhailovii]